MKCFVRTSEVKQRQTQRGALYQIYMNIMKITLHCCVRHIYSALIIIIITTDAAAVVRRIYLLVPNLQVSTRKYYSLAKV